jgi:two-component system, chemotaxis family, protein-glutamate methylesterase/glutaminase
MARPARDVIVIGGSAGAVEMLRTVLGDLPVDLGAAVAITLHRSPTLPSSLAGVFARRSSLDVIEPEDGEPFVPGRIYLAPPDRHMLICDDVIRLNRGPRQHHTRPAIDPMFISAAESCPGRVIGLLVTGNLSDGVSGLIRVKEMGGVSLVQDPREALYPSMPRTALIYDHVDLILATESVAPILGYLVQGAVVPSIVETSNVRRPGPRHERAPHRFGPSHRLP